MNNGIPPRWRHQQEAFEFVRPLKGAMLAMVPGTGKSRVAIDYALDLDVQLILIVCPLRVVPVWEGQFQKFAPDQYSFLALDDRVGSVQKKTLAARDLLAWSQKLAQRLAIAINYDSARREPFASWAIKQIWPLVILDESHKIKQPGGRTSKWAARLGLGAMRRLALTGTPMAHQPTDIWAQFRFLDPHLLDPAFSSFRNRYAVLGGWGNKEIVGWRYLDHLEKDFRRIAFRVDESVLDLPPELDQTLTTQLDPEGARLYGEMERKMIAWIEEGRQVTAANAMVRLLRLQQITGGTVTDEQANPQRVDRAKQALLQDLLEDIEEPVVVFARFRPDFEAIQAAASACGFAYFELSGVRDELARWQSGTKAGRAVLAVQMQAGGVGVDLSRARIAIYYSLGFSLSDYLQSRARIRRPPQQRPCIFYHLQIRNSIDEYILRAVEARRDLVDSVLQELRKKGTASYVRVAH